MRLSDRIGRRIKLQDLNTLMAVVQSGSMGKAARHLNTSQPNISKSIADLEQALGVSLLDRHPHGVEPTEYGRALLNCGATVFDELRQGIRNIEFLSDPTAGEVRIGCIPPLATGFVSAVADRMSQRFPRIVFHLLTANTEALHRGLHDRNVDLLIARSLDDPVADERESFEFLFEDSYVVVAGLRHPMARRRSIKLGELVSLPWVLPPKESPPGLISAAAFRASGLDYPRVTIVTISPDVRMSFLATGRYLTIFSTSGLQFPIGRPALKMLPVGLPLDPVQIGIITLKNRTLSPTAELFISTARAVATPLTTLSGRGAKPSFDHLVGAKQHR